MDCVKIWKQKLKKNIRLKSEETAINNSLLNGYYIIILFGHKNLKKFYRFSSCKKAFGVYIL